MMNKKKKMNLIKAQMAMKECAKSKTKLINK